jgi:DNA-binding transcriptional MerR regulator
MAPVNIERWRVEELAAASGVSVDTIRFYQKRRLLAAPAREGRVAWYGTQHRDRLLRIRELQGRGLPLNLIGRVLDGASSGDADARLAAAVAGKAAGIDLTQGELAERTGVSVEVIDVLSAAGLLAPRMVDGELHYSVTDADLVATGRRLLDVGLPIDELLDLARHYHEVTVDIADRAVAMFNDHIRTPIRRGAGAAEEKAERLVTAFEVLFPAVTSLVSDHFAGVLLERAEAALAEAERHSVIESRTA